MMRNFLSAVVCVTVLSFSAATAQPAAAPKAPPMTLTSTAFTDGGIIPDKYSGDSNVPVSPSLMWANAPTATVSFAIIMHDLDSLPRKAGPDNLHWMIFNIPATVTSLPEGLPATGQLPDGTIQIVNGGGKVGYLPLGARVVYHHYAIELYALDTKLSLGPDASRADATAALEGHVIGKAAYVGRFHL